MVVTTPDQLELSKVIIDNLCGRKVRIIFKSAYEEISVIENALTIVAEITAHNPFTGIRHYNIHSHPHSSVTVLVKLLEFYEDGAERLADEVLDVYGHSEQAI